jgi:predicted amidohydrolase
MMKRKITICLALMALTCATGQGSEPQPGASAQRYVRVGHYQCICQQGDFAANVATVEKGLQLATEAGLDIVSFPEAMLTGYFAHEADARQHAVAIDSPQMRELLQRTERFNIMFLVGFTQQRDGKLYDTVAVIERGKVLGHYDKAMPIFPYLTPGREFPVFEKKGLTFGIVICADGGYIEPARILALKGARFIFAPHYNFVGDPVDHYQMVRNDHVARAIENGVYFLRGNNVVPGRAVAGLGELGYGYGDSYVLDPNGEIVAGAGLNDEYLMIYNLDLEKKYRNRPVERSRTSARELLGILSDAMNAQ